MAEDIFNREPMAIPMQRRSTRRAFLKGLFAAGVGVLAAPKALEAVNEVFVEKPSEVYIGAIDISIKDVNLRDAPERHNAFYGDFGPFPFKDIKKINGRDYHGEPVLSILNPIIVVGSNPDNPNDVGTGRWGKITVDFSLTGEKNAYYSISNQTKNYMQFHSQGGFSPVKESQGGIIALADGTKLALNQVNIPIFRQEFPKIAVKP